MSEVKRKVIYEDDSLVARVEEVNSILFIHITVKQMKKATISFLKKRFPKFKNNVKKSGYDALYTYSRTPKFYQFFGGYEDIGEMEWEGENYRILKWVLK